jgi:hypothetical protein
MTETENLCPECGEPMQSAGLRKSGDTLVPSYLCRPPMGCGRVTIHPMHHYYNSLRGSRLRPLALPQNNYE